MGMSNARTWDMRSEDHAGSDDGAPTRELFRRVEEDLKTIARDEIALLRGEVGTAAKAAAIEAAGATFGGIVALIGLGMLSVAVVVALAPWIESLTLRLIVMAIVYGAIGGGLAAIFGARLRREIIPRLTVPAHELKATLEGAQQTLHEEGRHAHA
jgi:hypothetical protein